MAALRVIFFRMYESPRYLVTTGRPAEAVENLQLISRFNGEELSINLQDVRDHFNTVKSPRESLSFSVTSPTCQRPEEEQAFLPTTSSSIIFDAGAEGVNETTKVSGGSPDSVDYNTTGETNGIRNNGYSFTTPTIESPDLPTVTGPLRSSRSHDHHRHLTDHSMLEDEDDEQELSPRSPRSRPTMSRRRNSSVVSRTYEPMGWLPRFIRKPLWAYVDKLSLVLAPEWIWKTLTVWAMWFSITLGMFLWQKLMALTRSIAFTMFNVFLPKLLEQRHGGTTPESPQPSLRSIAQIRSAEPSLEDSLWEVVIYSLGGCPGAIVSALIRDYRVEPD